MSFSLATLTSYTQQNAYPILDKAVLGSNFFQTPGLVKLNNVGGLSVAIPTLNTTAYATAGGCGATNSGTTAIAQVSVGLCPMKFTVVDCVQSLLDYFTYQYATNSSYPELTSDFQEKYVIEKVKKISLDVEELVWGGAKGVQTGTTTMGSSYSVCSSSILKSASDNKATLASSAATTAITVSNAVTVVNSLIALVPDAIITAEDLMLFVSPTEFQNIKMALVSQNLYSVAVDPKATSIAWPYANLTIVAVAGLKGKGQQVLTTASNIAVATKVENETGSPIVYHDVPTDYVYFIANARIGARIIFPELAVVTW